MTGLQKNKNVQDNGVSVTALVVVGGVAANKELRRMFGSNWL